MKLLYQITLTDLSTEVEVAEKDGRLRAGHNQDNKGETQKSEHVVHLMRPEQPYIQVCNQHYLYLSNGLAALDRL